MKAVIMCGGAATRMRPVTETIPKPLLKVAGVPIIDIIAKQLIENGIEELYITLGFMADEITDHVNRSSYSDKVEFVREDKPLGTAGGVKNALGDIQEDFIAVCGDNLFNFQIKEILGFHNKINSDLTLVSVKNENTSEYGVITADDDGTVLRFCEKPLPGETDSDLINTGFYVVGKKAMKLIPDGRYFDFSNDLFPLLMSTELKLSCYEESGYWGDIGDFESYIAVNSDILAKSTGMNVKLKGLYFEQDADYNNSRIIAPCLIDKHAYIGSECIIGPNVSIGPYCTLEDGVKLDNSIMLENSELGLRSEASCSVFCEEATVGAYVGIGKYCAFGEGCIIENYCRVDDGTRIWPRVRITENSRVSQNIFCKPAATSFFMSSLTGTVFSEISSDDVLRLGQAAASVNKIKKIGIACDEKRISELLAKLFSCGVISSGGSVYNFGSAFASQMSFFASYCSLDLSVFISVDDSTANFSFTGAKGLPAEAGILRKIRSICKFSGFSKVSPSFISSEYDMSLINEVYYSFLKNEIKGKPTFEFCVVCSNNILTETLENVLQRAECKKGMGGIRIFINDEGTRMYIQDGERVYSSDEILCACAVREFENGNDVILSEDAPAIIEQIAADYKRKTERVYTATDRAYSEETAQAYRNNRWAYDSLFLICKFISIMATENKSADEIMEKIPRFSSKHFSIDVNINPSKMCRVLNSVGAQKSIGDVFYKINGSQANARIRTEDRAGRLKVLIEANNSETAREFARDLTLKINKEAISTKKT